MIDKFQHIILKFFSGEATKTEIQELEEWLKNSEENRKAFDKINELWQLNEKNLQNFDLNLNKAWQKISSQIKKKSTDYKKNPLLIGHNKLQLFKIAAVGLILISLTFSLMWLSKSFNTTKPAVVTIFAPQGEKAKAQLADGTTIWLNSGSSLKYTTDFNKTNRNVFLEGEAFFDVTHDKSNLFIVNTKNTKIKVWGTCFNVRAYIDDNIVETTLKKGSISMKLPKQNKEIYIKPGQQLLYSKANSSLKIKNVDVDVFTSWKYDILKFDNTGFNEIIKKLERWYGVHIITDNKIKHDNRYTMTIKTESLKEVLKRIKITTPIDYKIEVDSVFIYSKK